MYTKEYGLTEQQQKNEKTPEHIGREFLSISLALKEHFLEKMDDARPGLNIMDNNETLSDQNYFLLRAFDCQTAVFNG